MQALENIKGIKVSDRTEIKVNPIGINHFTWLTEAKYKNIDIFPIYSEFVEKYAKEGYVEGNPDSNWVNSTDFNKQMVKFDLFKKYGYIAAAGDRHLAEFCEGKWYLKNPETVKRWGFSLTEVAKRKKGLEKRIERSRKLRCGEEKLQLEFTGEEGVLQIRALLGLVDLVTNVNIPNVGQIPNLPLGAVVETNAVFRADSLVPVAAGEIPVDIYPLISRICGIQEGVDKGIAERDFQLLFNCFVDDPLVTCSYDEAEELFKEMVLNTKKYLESYDLSSLS